MHQHSYYMLRTEVTINTVLLSQSLKSSEKVMKADV